MGRRRCDPRSVSLWLWRRMSIAVPEGRRLGSRHGMQTPPPPSSSPPPPDAHPHPRQYVAAQVAEFWGGGGEYCENCTQCLHPEHEAIRVHQDSLPSSQNQKSPSSQKATHLLYLIATRQGLVLFLSEVCIEWVLWLVAQMIRRTSVISLLPRGTRKSMRYIGAWCAQSAPEVRLRLHERTIAGNYWVNPYVSRATFTHN